MHIRHLEWIFSIDKVVPVDFISSFLADTITMLFIQVHFYRSHTFTCRSLLLSTTVLNDTLKLNWEDKSYKYRMAQNFDGGKFWRIGLGKFLQVKNWQMPMVQLIIMLTAHTVVHANLLLLRIYSYVTRKSLIAVCTCICSYINCKWYNINQPHLFWVVAGAWRRERDITSRHVHWLVSTYAGMMVNRGVKLRIMERIYC